jgi:hypothetical protein
MSYYLLGVVICFVIFGTLSYALTGWTSAEMAPDAGPDTYKPDADEPWSTNDRYDLPETVSGDLPVHNGGFDIDQYPENCPECNGPCEFGPVPMSTDEPKPKFDKFGDSLKPAKKSKKKSVKKPTKKTKKSNKTKKVKSLLEQMFEDAPKDKKSKKPSKKK